MPIYEFTPVDPSHPDWKVSDLKGRCRVHARDEQRAKSYLRAWLDSDLYDCKGVTRGPLPEYREGLIETDQGRGGGLTRLGLGGYPVANIGRERWVQFNADKLPPFSENSDNKGNGGVSPTAAVAAATAPASSAWGKGTWGKGAWAESAWGHSSAEEAEPSTEPEAVELSSSDTPNVRPDEAEEIQPVEIQNALEATRQQFVRHPQELVARTKLARANTTVALEILDEFRGNSEQHAKIKTLLVEQMGVLDTIEDALRSDGSKESAFNSYVEQFHKILTSFLEVISEKGTIRSALAIAACGLVAMTGIGGDVVIGPIVAASILGWDQKILVKLVDGLSKFRKPQREDNDD